jgi:outer membrane protein assembly factor BamB
MQPRTRNRCFLFALVILPLAWGLAGASDWPRFRGPNGAGIATDKDVPVKWTADDGVLWKTAIPGIGHSSPIVHGGRVFLESSSEDGKTRLLLALDAATGEIVWKTNAPGRTARKHPLNSLASSTPTTDGERVYAVFWDGADIHLAAYDFKHGKPIWTQNLGRFVSQHGVGHSPMLIDGKVILANDQDGTSHLHAFDARTGAKVWQTERRPFRTCYSTPFIRTRENGTKEIIVASTAGITGYDPDNGKANWSYTWSFPKKPLRTVASPIAGNGLVFATSGDGDGSRHAIAIKLGVKGDVTPSNLVWENGKERYSPYVPCLLVKGEHLYSVSDTGHAACHIAATGEEVWREQVSKDGFTASPILVDGKVYAVAKKGTVFVFEAAPTFKLLAKNAIGESVSSTPAVADNRLFIRGEEHLFCIAKPPAKKAARGR